jgi:hypothetical protein
MTHCAVPLNADRVATGVPASLGPLCTRTRACDVLACTRLSVSAHRLVRMKVEGRGEAAMQSGLEFARNDPWTSGWAEPWPTQCQEQHRLMAHTAGASKDGFDGAVQRRVGGRSSWNALKILSHREVERRAGTVIRHGPESPAVLLDDGTADREAHPHTTALRGVERLEHAVRELRVNAGARVLHRDADAIVCLRPERSDRSGAF